VPGDYPVAVARIGADQGRVHGGDDRRVPPTSPATPLVVCSYERSADAWRSTGVWLRIFVRVTGRSHRKCFQHERTDHSVADPWHSPLFRLIGGSSDGFFSSECRGVGAGEWDLVGPESEAGEVGARRLRQRNPEACGAGVLVGGGS
jgi:hypothetical protein